MLVQLSPSCYIDPREITGIVLNRSESGGLRQTRLYLKGGRTITVDCPLQHAVDMVSAVILADANHEAMS